MASCPRCGDTYTTPPALSRTDDRTPVCPACGTIEAVEVMNGNLVPQTAWPIVSG